MKIALVHDYLKEYGGAERVLESLHDLYPKAPVYTSVFLPKFLGPHAERFQKWAVKTSLAQILPLKAKLISPLRILSPLLFKQFNFSGYDVVLTSATGAYFPNALRKKQAKLVCYCHTPPRYLYGYATAREMPSNVFLSVISTVVFHWLRIIDFEASKNVDLYIANSEEVASRIRKFYKREAVVVNPPIDMPRIKVKEEKRTYFVAGGRLARAKHVDLAIAACLELGVPLKIFGKSFAGYGEDLQKMTGGSDLIEFLGEISEKHKWELLAGATAYIFPAEDEDFGILPVEAMASGTPVIAYRSGGVTETIVENKTGLFFDSLDKKSIVKSIKEFMHKDWSAEGCRKRAEEYSEERFQKKIKEVVEKTIRGVQ